MGWKGGFCTLLGYSLMDNRSYWVLSFAKAGDRSTFLFNVGGGKVRAESKDAIAAHRP